MSRASAIIGSVDAATAAAPPSHNCLRSLGSASCVPAINFAASESGDPAGILEACALGATIVPADGDEGGLLVHRVLVGWKAMGEGETARAAEPLQATVAWAGDAHDEMLVFWGSVGALFLGDDRGWGDLLARAIALSRSSGALGVLAESLSVRSLSRS